MSEASMSEETGTEVPDIEAEARDDGWAPKDEWKGDPARWVDAETFVKRGQKINGILKSKLEKLESELERVKSTNQEFGEFHKKQMEKEAKQREKLLAELESARAQAITDGDGAAAVKAEKEIRSLENEVPKTANEQNQMAQRWVADNQWYETNIRLQGFADGIAEKVVREGYTGQAYFNELTRRVKEAFPEEFSNPKRSKPNGVEDGGTEVKSERKSFDNLPADAKKAYDEFVKGGIKMTKAEYLAQYDLE